MAYPIIRRTIVPWVLSKLGRIEGLEFLPARGPFIVVANHVSYAEPPIIATLIINRTRQRVYSLTKYGVWKLFRLFFLSDWLGMIPVEPWQRDRCLEKARQKLKEGYPVLVFPEGTRTPDPTSLGKGKTGAARLALATGVPVVPIGYHGPNAPHPVASTVSFFKKRRNMLLRIGPLLRFPLLQHEQVTADVLRATTTTIMNAISALCGKPYLHR